MREAYVRFIQKQKQLLLLLTKYKDLIFSCCMFHSFLSLKLVIEIKSSY